MRSRVSGVFVCGLGPVVDDVVVSDGGREGHLWVAEDDVAGLDQGQVAAWYVRVASVAGLEGVGDGEGFDCGGHGPIYEQPRKFRARQPDDTSPC